MNQYKDSLLLIKKHFQEYLFYRSPILQQRLNRLENTIKKNDIGRVTGEINYFLILIKKTQERLEQGDNFIFHPNNYCGINNGEIALAHEKHNGTLWRINISRKPDVKNCAIHINISGPSGFGKSTVATIFIRQVVRKNIAKCLVFDKYGAITKRLGSEVNDFKIIKWYELS